MRILWKCHRKKIKRILLKLFLYFFHSNQNHKFENNNRMMKYWLTKLLNTAFSWCFMFIQSLCRRSVLLIYQEVNSSMVIIPPNLGWSPLRHDGYPDQLAALSDRRGQADLGKSVMLTFTEWEQLRKLMIISKLWSPHLSDWAGPCRDSDEM